MRACVFARACVRDYVRGEHARRMCNKYVMVA